MSAQLTPPHAYPCLCPLCDDAADAREDGIEHLAELLADGACPDDELQALHQALFGALYYTSTELPVEVAMRMRPEITAALARHAYDWYAKRASERAADAMMEDGV